MFRKLERKSRVPEEGGLPPVTKGAVGQKLLCFPCLRPLISFFYIFTALLVTPIFAIPFLGSGIVQAQPSRLVVMVEAPPKTLDPFFATDATGVRISHQLIFDTLVKLDDRLEIVPGLAESWQRISPTRYLFRLRSGVRFHGFGNSGSDKNGASQKNGVPLSADDLVYTLESLLDPALGSPYGSVLRDKISSVTRKGPLDVEIRLKGPYASILSDLLLPVRSKAAGRDNPLVGTGPFRFIHQKANEILLERNDQYHGKKAGVEQVVFKVIRDENTRLLKLNKGTVDLAINVLPLNKLALFQKGRFRKQFTVLEAPGLSYQYLGFNLRDPALGKLKVRQAIAHAIKVDTLITFRQKGHSVRSTGLFPPGSPYADPGLKPLPYDPVLAGKLLDQAGYPLKDGQRLRLAYKTSTDRAAVIQARVIQSDLKKVGIQVEVRSFEWGTFYEDISKGNFQLFSLRWIGVNDPDFYYELFHSSRTPPDGRNRGFYNNPQLDELLEQGRLEGDSKRRITLYRRVNRILHRELPYLSLWHNNNVAIVSKSLTGFRLHPSGGFEYLPDVSKITP